MAKSAVAPSRMAMCGKRAQPGLRHEIEQGRGRHKMAPREHLAGRPGCRDPAAASRRRTRAVSAANDASPRLESTLSYPRATAHEVCVPAASARRAALRSTASQLLFDRRKRSARYRMFEPVPVPRSSTRIGSPGASRFDDCARQRFGARRDICGLAQSQPVGEWVSHCVYHSD